MKKAFIALSALSLLFVLTPAYANPKVIKAYKEAFEGEKPKCLACHVDEKPKKEGPHDLNEYGKKVQEAAKKATPAEAVYDASVFKALGKAPEKS
jgi:hypothetical protein